MKKNLMEKFPDLAMKVLSFSFSQLIAFFKINSHTFEYCSTYEGIMIFIGVQLNTYKKINSKKTDI